MEREKNRREIGKEREGMERNREKGGERGRERVRK